MADEPQATAAESKDPQWYRDAIEKANRERDEAITQLAQEKRERVLGDIPGLDPSKGLGQTMVESYQGPWEKDAFLEFAKERFEFVPGQPDGGRPNPAASGVNEIVESTSEDINKSLAETHSLDPAGLDPIDKRIAEAEAAGNIALAVSLKTQKVMNQL